MKKKEFFEKIAKDREKLIEAVCSLPKNIFRLLKDAVFLYENKSFSSSFVLSTYAIEEFAKLHVVLDCLDPENPFDLKKKAEILQKVFGGRGAHVFKQLESIRILGSTIDFCKRNPDKVHFLAWGMSSKYSEERMTRLYQLFATKTGALEEAKRDNIYVDFAENGNVNVPRIDEERVFEQIEMVFDLFEIFTLSINSNPQLQTVIKPFKNRLVKSCPSLEALNELSKKIYFPKIEKELRKHMRNTKKGERLSRSGTSERSAQPSPR